MNEAADKGEPRTGYRVRLSGPPSSTDLFSILKPSIG